MPCLLAGPNETQTAPTLQKAIMHHINDSNLSIPEKLIGIYWWLIRLVRKLHKLHERDIIHGDLKMANILVGRNRKNKPVVQLIDFGYTRKCGESIIYLEDPSYLAPEHRRSDTPASATQDIYAFGSTVLHTIISLANEESPMLFTLMDPLIELHFQCIEKLPRRRPDLLSIKNVLKQELTNNIEAVVKQSVVSMVDTISQQLWQRKTLASAAKPVPIPAKR